MSLQQEICDLFNQVTKREDQEVDLQRPLKEYGIDSVKAVKLLSNLEVHFDIDISEERAQDICCLQDVIDIVNELKSAI